MAKKVTLIHHNDIIYPRTLDNLVLVNGDTLLSKKLQDADDGTWITGHAHSADTSNSAITSVSATTDESGNNIKASYVASADYDSANKKIILKNKNGVQIDDLDATAFIKDGMVNTVSIQEVTGSGQCLVITFNTDAGKEDINIKLTDIFDSGLYYTSAQTDERYVKIADVESGITSASTNPVQSKVIYETLRDNEYVVATALNDLDGRITNLEENPSVIVDSALTSASTNPVESQALYKVIASNEKVTATALCDLDGRVNTLASQVDDIEGAVRDIYDGNITANSAITSLSATTANSATTDSAGHNILTTYVSGASYDATANKIYLKNGNGANVSEIDATPFTKDGMVDTVTVGNVENSGLCLVISFNGDANHEDIVIPVSDMFVVDSAVTSASTNPVTSQAIYDTISETERVTATALNDLDERIRSMSSGFETINGRIDGIEGDIDIINDAITNIYDGNITVNSAVTSISARTANSATTAVSATTDESGNNIKASYVASADYDSANKKIILKNKNGVQIDDLDATAFIKDGMVSTVSVQEVTGSGQCLVITFNTDAGKDPINIKLSDLFDSSLYYTSAQTDERYVKVSDVESGITSASTNPVQSKAIYEVITDNEEITAAALCDLDDRIDALASTVSGYDGRITNNAQSITNITNGTTTVGNASRATSDQSGNNIKSSYASSMEYVSSSTTIVLKNKNGGVLSTINTSAFSVTADSAITSASTNPVQSKVLYDVLKEDEMVTAAALDDLNERISDVEDSVSGIGTEYVKKSDVESAVTENSQNPVSSDAVYKVITENELAIATALCDLDDRVVDLTEEVSGKQATLVSGANIKTINNQSLLGNGNITISGGSGSGEANVIEVVKVNGTALTPDANKAVNIPLATSSSDGAMSSSDKTYLSALSSFYTYSDLSEMHYLTATDSAITITSTASGNESEVDLYPGSIGLIAPQINLSGTNVTVNNKNIYFDSDTGQYDGLLYLKNTSIAESGMITIGPNFTENNIQITPNGIQLNVGNGDTVDYNGNEVATVSQLSGKQDTFANANVLSGITSAKVSNWDNASASAHTHSNKTVLDGITSAKVTNWDNAFSSAHTHSNKTALDTVTSAKITNWDNAFTSAHTHANKTALDTVTSAKITNWDNAFSSAHTHSNKTVLDGITSAKVSSWDGKATGSISNGTVTINGSSITPITGVTVNGQAMTVTGGVASIPLTAVLPAFTSSDNGKILGVVNGALAWVTPTTIYTGSGTPSSSQGNDGDIYLQTS